MLGIPSSGSQVGGQFPLEPDDDAVLHKAPRRDLVAFDHCLRATIARGKNFAREP
jgi:hypothetical protein